MKSTSSGPKLTMTVVPEKQGARPVVITVSNKTKRSRYVNPSDSAVRLAGQLKIGDKVNVSYDQLYSTRTFTGARVVESADSASTPLAFSFRSLQRVRHGKEYYQAVVAGKGAVTWTFLLPNVEAEASPTETESAGDKASPRASKIPGQPTPDPELLKKVRKYRSGDEVHLTYEPYKYVFALKDIETVQQEGEGVLTVNKETTRSGKKYWMLSILTRRRSVVAFVPPADAGGDGAGSAGLLATVKEIKLRQKVAFKYRREGGLNWLDEISAQ
jgi:hypothetical protein